MASPASVYRWWRTAIVGRVIAFLYASLVVLPLLDVYLRYSAYR